MRVMKFGGTSVGSAERMRGVVRLVGEAVARERVLVVASAVSGVTNLLIDGARTATEGEPAGPVGALFREIHGAILAELTDHLPADLRESLGTAVDALTAELESLLQGVSLLHECSPSVLAHLSGLGERTSCAIL
ncbi:MAG TPA: bifunctional aspartate kinase/homoserine dehydrogenase I, partial [Thermoanaerobaculia bacterium]